MRRFTSIDYCALALAALLAVLGSFTVVHPIETAWTHPTTDPATFASQSYIEVFSKKQSRVYGALAVVLGAGLAVFVIFPRRK